MRYILAIAVLANSLSVHAQKYSVKLYANLTTAKFTTPFTNTFYGLNYRNSYREMISPSVAFTVQNKRKNYHEFEWSRLQFDREDKQQQISLADTNYYQNMQRISTVSVAVRYEYIVNLVKNRKYILQPSLGFAAMPYYNRYSATPYLSSDYPTAQTVAGIKHFIVPRVNVSLSRRLYADVNVPVCVLDIGTMKQRISDPRLSAVAQKYSIIDASAFNYYTARVGLGLRL